MSECFPADPAAQPRTCGSLHVGRISTKACIAPASSTVLPSEPLIQILPSRAAALLNREPCMSPAWHRTTRPLYLRSGWCSTGHALMSAPREQL